MVKITGRSRGVVHLKQHLDYITRNGRLQAELQDGSKVETRADIRALHEDWLAANILGELGRHRPGAAQSVGIILSMPEGTPPDRVHDAARSWARTTLGGHDWLLVRHDDRGHPHVHVTVRAVGPTGKRLTAGPADLQRWRETFARELRRFAIEAEATPRKARGLVQKPERSAIYRIIKRGGHSVVVERRLREAITLLVDQPPKPTKWEQSIQTRQRSIQAAYLNQADELGRGQPDERQLGSRLRSFVAEQPAPLTRHQAAIASARRRDAVGLAALETNPSRPPELPDQRVYQPYGRSEPRR